MVNSKIYVPLDTYFKRNFIFTVTESQQFPQRIHSKGIVWTTTVKVNNILEDNPYQEITSGRFPM